MLKNIFDIPWIGPLARAVWPWRLIRLALLVILLVMAAYGWHHHAIPGVAVPDPLMYTNIANYFLWVLWIMGVVFLALLMGRIWCTVCPLGWLNGVVARFGLQRELPRPLRNFIPVTLTLVALQLAVYLLAIHRFPDYTAVLIALMLLGTITCGLLFRKRAFCSLLCPAGAVFGLYARVAPWQLRVKDVDVCAACADKPCVSGDSYWKQLSLGPAILSVHCRRPDCPVDLVPAEISDSATCSLCLHCAQNCDKDNILLGRRPWLADLRGAALSPSETFFFVVLLGMVTANFAKVFVELREGIFWLPQQAALLLGWAAPGFYLLAGLWVTLAFPLLLLLPAYLVLRLGEMRTTVASGGDLPLAPTAPPAASAGFWRQLGELSLPLIPLLLAAHVVLAVVKLNAKIGYFPYVLQDPTGVKSYLAMNVMTTVTPPGVLIPLDILKWLVLALLVAGFLLALLAARRVMTAVTRQSRTFTAAAMTAALTLTLLYGATVIRWLFIR